jgi:hypothetical protein
MAENKKGFILYADQIDLFSQLPNEKAGELIKHIFAYVNDEEPRTDDLIINLAFTPIKQQLKRDLQKFEQTKKQRSEAGKRSAELRKKQRTSTKATSVQRTSTKATVTDNVNVNVKDKVKDINNNNSNYCKVCLNDIVWLEAIAMKCKVRIDVIKLYLDNFIIHLVAMDEDKKSIKEFKSHYVNWIQKQDLSHHKTKITGRSNQIK